MPNILVVEDCPEYAATICEMLAEAGHDAISVGCAEDAYEELKDEDFDLIICDMMIPVSNGTDAEKYNFSPEVGAHMLWELSKIFPTLPLVAISGEVPFASLRRTAAYGAIACLAKPFHYEELLCIVNRSLSNPFAPHVQ